MDPVIPGIPHFIEGCIARVPNVVTPRTKALTRSSITAPRRLCLAIHLVNERNLVQVRLELLGDLSGLPHVHYRLGVLEHRLEVFSTPPLGVVGDLRPVDAL